MVWLVPTVHALIKDVPRVGSYPPPRVARRCRWRRGADGICLVVVAHSGLQRALVPTHTDREPLGMMPTLGGGWAGSPTTLDKSLASITEPLWS